MSRRFEVSRGCTFCGTCVFECPADAIFMDGDGAHIDPDKCTGCGKCHENCASEAICHINGDMDYDQTVP